MDGSGESIVNDVLGPKQSSRRNRSTDEGEKTEGRHWERINSASLSLDRPPGRLWIAQDWVPIGVTTALYADGGIGKTLLALQLQCSTAATIPWCGLATMQCRSLGLYCEDDADELHRRQLDICDAAGITPSELGSVTTISGYGLNNVLVEPGENGCMQSTTYFHGLKKWIREEQAKLVVLDTAADLFAGNENDRQQVRQFIGFLNGLAYDEQCAVFLNAHPSKDGIKTSKLDGGSTAWNNTVRSRLTLDRAAGDDADPAERVLRRAKANYAGIGDDLRLRWAHGVMQPIAAPGGFAAMARSQDADGIFLTLLARHNAQGVRVSQSQDF
jgi:RecA-family ATPase